MVLNNRRRKLNDNDYGLDKEAFVFVVLEVWTKVIEAVIGVLFEVRSYQDWRIFVEEDADYAQGPKPDAFVAVLNGLEEVAQ